MAQSPAMPTPRTSTRSQTSGRAHSAQAHIIVIDDDPDLRALFADLLTDEGHRVTVRTRADEWTSALATLVPDLLIVDHLGASTGMALLRRLRTDPAFAALPVLLCTAAHEQMRELAAELAELQAWVVLKPFDIDALLGAVNDLLGIRG